MDPFLLYCFSRNRPHTSSMVFAARCIFRTVCSLRATVQNIVCGEWLLGGVLTRSGSSIPLFGSRCKRGPMATHASTATVFLSSQRPLVSSVPSKAGTSTGPVTNSAARDPDGTNRPRGGSGGGDDTVLSVTRPLRIQKSFSGGK